MERELAGTASERLLPSVRWAPAANRSVLSLLRDPAIWRGRSVRTGRGEVRVRRRAPAVPPAELRPLGIVGIVVIVVVVLVAATILISFLLYIEVSGLAHGPSPTSIPLGTAFDFGSPQTTNCTGAWAAAGGCATLSDFAYQVPVLLSTVSLGDVGFSVTTSSGVVFHNSGVADVAAVANTGQVLAYSVIAPGAGISMVGGWVHYGGGFFPSTPLTSFDSIVIDMGQEQSTVGQSLVFQAIGLNGYSGIVSSQLP